MIDIHTHILHKCDDGSTSLDLSVSQIRNMIKNGITNIVLTPHYLNSYVETESEIIDKRFEELTNEIKDLQVKVHKGAEVFLNPGVDEKIDQGKCIGDSSYILVETNMTEFTPDIYETLFKLVQNGYKPILAHPERYNYVTNDPSIAEDFLHRNVYLQINAGSILGFYGARTQKVAWELIDRGFAHFIASDNHCRNDHYILPDAVKEIRNNIDDYTADLLSKHNPQKVLNNEDIKYFYLKKQPEEKHGFFEKILRKL